MRIRSQALITSTLIVVCAPPATAQFSGLTQWNDGPGANGHWYAILENAADFREPKSIAESLGAYIVSITSAEENRWVYDRFIDRGTCAPVWCVPATFYIGLERAYSGGPFGWLSGEPLAFTAWNVGEPNDQGDERVTHMFQDKGQVLWNDIAFNSNPMAAVIEWTDLPPDLTTVPEPATVAMIAMGLAGLAAAGAFRRRAGR